MQHGWPWSIPYETAVIARYLAGLPGRHGYGSGATARVVASDLADHIRGRVVLLTGGTSGIGLEAARAIASVGGVLVLGVRDLARGAKLEQELVYAHPACKIHLLQLDTSSLDSIRSAANSFIKLGLPLHVLLNNAGIMGCPQTYTSDGFELQFATNYLGHFYLTRLLLPVLIKSGGARVINVASSAHNQVPPSGLSFNDLQSRTAYRRQPAYAQSKLAQIYHAQELDRLATASHVDLKAIALNPGTVPTTNVLRNYDGWHLNRFIPSLGVFKTSEQAAATLIVCAYHPDAEHGQYYSDCDVATAFLHPQIHNEEHARRLWAESEHLLHLEPLTTLSPQTTSTHTGSSV